MYTPLEIIREWYISLPLNTQIELCNLTFLYHYDEEIMNEIDDSKRNSKYLDFMRSEFLEETEIIQRTLFLRSLFDFSMYNRATEEDWDVLLDRNLDLKNRITKLGKSTKKIDDMLNNWSDRKYHWISVCKKWKEVKEKHLSNNLLDLYIISCKWDFD